MEDDKPNRDIALGVLREIALTESTDDEVRLQAASYLLHADESYDAMPPVLELVEEIADKAAAKAVEALKA